MKTIAEEMRATLNMIAETTQPSKEFMHALNQFINGSNYHLPTHQKNYITKVFDAEMPVLEQGYKVYRAMVLPGWSSISTEADFRDKDHIRFGDYMSTSLANYVADRILENNHSDPIHIMLTIHTLPGVRGIKVADYAQFGAKIEVPDMAPPEEEGEWEPEITDVEDEKEIILSREAEFDVVAKELIKPEDMISPHPALEEHWEVELRQTK